MRSLFELQGYVVPKNLYVISVDHLKLFQDYIFPYNTAEIYADPEHNPRRVGSTLLLPLLPGPLGPSMVLLFRVPSKAQMVMFENYL